jgi:hypothetical protein
LSQLPHDCHVYTHDGVGERHPAPSTYIYAGYGTKGWPHDHSTEDAYEVPPFTWDGHPTGTVVKSAKSAEDREYTAEFRSDGGAVLVLRINKTIAHFETFTDAQIAAKALNELKGY